MPQMELFHDPELPLEMKFIPVGSRSESLNVVVVVGGGLTKGNVRISDRGRGSSLCRRHSGVSVNRNFFLVTCDQALKKNA